MPRYKVDGRKKNGLQCYRVMFSYIDSTGKRVQVSRNVYGLAAAEKCEEELREKYADASNEAHITVSELSELFFKAHRVDVRESSAQKTEQVIKTHILPYIGHIYIDKLGAKDLTKWKTELGGLDLKITTKRNVYKELRSMLNWAVRSEYLSSNPLNKVPTFRDAYAVSSRDKIKYYTQEQFQLFMNAAKDDAVETGDWRYFVFFSIAFYTGVRKGENNALRWSDIDGNILHIRRSVAQKLKGKDDVETPPKNESSNRDIMIPKPLIEVLEEQKSRQKQMTGFNDEWHVCGGEFFLRDTSIENKNRQYSKAAMLPHITIHDFRHSHASLLANEGINIQEVARRLGHSNVEITWNTYSHLYPREEERALIILNNIHI